MVKRYRKFQGMSSGQEKLAENLLTPFLKAS
jgi:hypothetical protein